MKLLRNLLLTGMIATPSIASSWGFNDGSLTIQAKTASSKSPIKEKLVDGKAIRDPLSVKSHETLKIVLTTTNGGKARRPHQTFLQLFDRLSGLETSFPLQVKDNGKAKLDLAVKDVPRELVQAASPLQATIFIASFGSSKPHKTKLFEVSFASDPSQPLPKAEKPVRYGKLPEIHHVFKSDQKNPPRIITLFFTAVVMASTPALLITWASLGANLNHLPQAFKDAPLPHSLFLLSIVALEGIFFLYYTHWKLFQVLPTALGIGLVTFLSGSRALREVQQRRITRSR